MNKKLIYINFAVIALLAVGLIYFIFQNQKILNNIAPSVIERETQQESPEASTTPATSPVASPKQLTTEDTQTAIQSYTNNTDRSALEDLMANTVNVVLYATDCCQPMPKADALKQLDYINEGLPISFDQKNVTIVDLKAKNPNFTNTYLGISQTKEHLIAFTIDPISNKITKIEMSVSWKLY